MKLKQCLLILMLTGILPVQLYAQHWSEEDSVWLSRVLSGKDTIRINPEFQKAIREGKLIHMEDEPGQQILEAPSELPLLKDFSEYLHADTDSIHNNVDYKSMPPSVYRLYKMELDTIPKINKEAYTPPPTRLIGQKRDTDRQAAGNGCGRREEPVFFRCGKRRTEAGNRGRVRQTLFFSGRYLEMDIFKRGKE